MRHGFASPGRLFVGRFLPAIVMAIAGLGVATAQNVAAQRPNADGHVTTHVEPIELRGSSYRALRESIERHARKSTDGAAGTTRITFRPATTYQRRNALCQVRQAAVDLEIDTQLPSWNQPADASCRAIQAWRRYSRYVEAHEKRHEQIARAFREKMVAVVRKIDPAVSCDRLRERVHNAMLSVSEKHDAAQKAFDRTERSRAQRLMRGHLGKVLQ